MFSILLLYSKIHFGITVALITTTIIVYKYKSPLHAISIGGFALLAILAGAYLVFDQHIVRSLREFGSLDWAINHPRAIVLYAIPALTVACYWSSPVTRSHGGQSPQAQHNLLLGLSIAVPLAFILVYVFTRSTHVPNAHWFALALCVYSAALLVPMLAEDRPYRVLARLATFQFPRSMADAGWLAAQVVMIWFVAGMFIWYSANSYRFLSIVAAEIHKGTGDAALAAVQRIKKARQTSPKSLIVYVPPQTTEFWLMLPKCKSKSLFIPALTGLPMLKGVPPSYMGCDNLLDGYGYDEYGPESRARSMNRLEACTAAKAKGFSKIFVLRTPLKSDNHELWDCDALKAKS